MGTVRFAAAFWMNRTSWPALRDACRAAEAAGWDALYVDDHLLADEGDWTDAKFEGWTTLGALAEATSTPMLGLLVSANTFRPPGLTAKLAVTLDHLSGGRAILGIGGGWFEREHEAFGIPFGSGFGERLDRLDESVGLIRRLLDGERVTHRGPAYTMVDAVCAPRPLQGRLPILIGGSGPRKTLRTIARYADMWNAYGPPDHFREAGAILRAHCAAEGRDPATIAWSVTLDVVVRDEPGRAAAAFAAVSSRHGLAAKIVPETGARYTHLLDRPAAVAEQLAAYVEAGVSEAIFVFRDPFDLETIERLGEVRSGLGALLSARR